MNAAINKINWIVNQALRQDPAFVQRISELNGKSLKVEIIDLKFDFILIFEEAGFQIESISSPLNDKITNKQEAFFKQDCEIKGTLGSYLNFFFDFKFNNYNNRQKDGLQISGDLHIAEEVYQIFSDLDFDWEELISQYTGDVVAHQIMRSLHQFKKGFAFQSERTFQNLNEYVEEEIKIVPRNEEVDQFCQAVDLLQNDSARLEARLVQLENCHIDNCHIQNKIQEKAEEKPE